MYLNFIDILLKFTSLKCGEYLLFTKTALDSTVDSLTDFFILMLNYSCVIYQWIGQLHIFYTLVKYDFVNKLQ